VKSPRPFVYVNRSALRQVWLFCCRCFLARPAIRSEDGVSAYLSFPATVLQCCQPTKMLPKHAKGRTSGFTLIELLVVIALLAILAGLLLPALTRARAKSLTLFCLQNMKQVCTAGLLYTDDANDRFPYNLASVEIKQKLAQDQFINWNSTIMNWELDTDNTNTVLLTRGGLGPYVSRVATVYRCPADRVVSDIQAAAGWTVRVRSISMNAMVGDAGQFSTKGVNVNNPDYRQFFKMSQMSQPAQVFVLIEEHPDSINDGYFLNHPDDCEWFDLPASYHDGGVNLTFADGHAETHKWQLASTRRPARPGAAHLPFALAPAGQGDFNWLMDRTSVDAE